MVEYVETSERVDSKSAIPTHRIGQSLPMSEDFFSFTYLSMLSHVHLLVVMF